MPIIESINIDKEFSQLHSEIERLTNEVHRISNKLNNGGYLSKAPAAAVEKEQKKMAELEKTISDLQASLGR